MKLSMKNFSIWMRQTNNKDVFEKYSKFLLQPIMKFNLDYCVLIHVKWDSKKPTTGWVSENYLGFCRLMKWYYHGLPLFSNEDKCLSKQLMSWKKVDMMTWLKANDCDMSGKKEELAIEIQRIMSKQSSNPVMKSSCYLSPTSCHELMCTLLSMISICMCNHVQEETISLLDSHIKLFLNKFHCMQDYTCQKKDNKGSEMHESGPKDSKGKQEPSWLSSYNCLSLLNLPEIIREFGPLRSIWEGDNQGEGYLCEAKPNIKHPLKKNWAVNVHKMLLKRGAKSILMSQDDQMEPKKSSKYYMYSSIMEVLHSLRENKPLSCLYMECSGVFSSVVHTSTGLKWVCLNIHHDKYKEKYGMKFYKFSHVPCCEGNYACADKYLRNNSMHYCLLLPELNENGYLPVEQDSYYYIINSCWMEYRNGLFGHNMAPGYNAMQKPINI